jgi:hypothetical protein
MPRRGILRQRSAGNLLDRVRVYSQIGKKSPNFFENKFRLYRQSTDLGDSAEGGRSLTEFPKFKRSVNAAVANCTKINWEASTIMSHLSVHCNTPLLSTKDFIATNISNLSVNLPLLIMKPIYRRIRMNISQHPQTISSGTSL